MRLVFFGTPGFSVPILEALVRSDFSVVAAVTQPSRPHGRGQDPNRIVPPPVARAAAALGVEVLQPERPADAYFVARLRDMQPDAIAVAAYRHILSDDLLEVAPLGGWNVHPSLLPRWRGPAPIHRTIGAGDAETGVSIIKMVRRMDAGPVAQVERTPVGPRETTGELERRLSAIGAAALIATLKAARDGTVALAEQNEAEATYAPTFKGEEREVRWNRPAVEIDRLIRAVTPHPGAYFMFRGIRVKAIEAEPAESAPPGTDAGTIVDRRPAESCRIACAEGCLRVNTVQPEGKQAMPMDSFIAGRRLKAGDRL